MKEISIARDIIPVGEFKAGLSQWLKSVQGSSRPLIITQNGRPTGVLLSPREFDRLRQNKAFIDSVQHGLADAESERVFEVSQLKQELKKRRAKRPAK